MKCEEVELQMIDYLDKNLDENTSIEIDKHLETCEKCLDEMKDTQQVLSLISKDENIVPDGSLRINFYHMLQSEIKKNGGHGKNPDSEQFRPWYNSPMYRIAAGVALFVCGTFIGLLINSGFNASSAANELKQLHSEISDMKKATMFTMLREESSSDRIQAVRYVEDIDKPDQNVIDVLVKTLNNDRNINVRMAAAYALSKYSDQRMVVDSLVKSLSLQRDPILQVTLINILAEKKEKSALKTINEIIANRSTMKEVRTVAQNSLRVLM